MNAIMVGMTANGPETKTKATLGSTALSFAKALVATGSVQGAVRHLKEETKEITQSTPFEMYALAAAVGVGMINRPFNHNGIVDDAISAISWRKPTSFTAGSVCALSAVIAALLDGWSMEGALHLALYVGEKGETFGRRTPTKPPIAVRLGSVMERIEELRLRLPSDRVDPSHLWQDVGEPLLQAIALAYWYRSAKQAWAALPAGSDAELDVVTSIAGALCAAEHPGSLPESDLDSRTKHGDWNDLIDAMAALR